MTCRYRAMPVKARWSAAPSALWKRLAETDYDPVTIPRKVVDRCMKNRGYEILSDLSKGA